MTRINVLPVSLLTYELMEMGECLVCSKAVKSLCKAVSINFTGMILYDPFRQSC